MKKFLSNNIHWLLFIVVGINLIVGFINFTYSKQDFIAIFFGIVGVLGITYLVIHIEIRKRRRPKEEE
ncbi:hypothetical protein [Psychrobacillus sp. OK032]|uniref:hypothetical protein n=1 Tax=Psychrobacillus sp. OK032 TaxID=1884358 RepID=UPI0008B2EC1B|nr:hypothetical protein [Psychrobacillus sp. OK032]SER51651.1 hypothetical protein SAMN05518872_10117 [Psychrobacillus sp. OK032]